MNDEHIERPTERDLERAKQNARTRRQLAWELLQQTRNPKYVALRYGYPIETMEKALEKVPEKPAAFNRSDSAASVHSAIKRASELLPENLRRSRVPGEDDE